MSMCSRFNNKQAVYEPKNIRPRPSTKNNHRNVILPSQHSSQRWYRALQHILSWIHVLILHIACSPPIWRVTITSYDPVATHHHQQYSQHMWIKLQRTSVNFWTNKDVTHFATNQPFVLNNFPRNADDVMPQRRNKKMTLSTYRPETLSPPNTNIDMHFHLTILTPFHISKECPIRVNAPSILWPVHNKYLIISLHHCPIRVMRLIKPLPRWNICLIISCRLSPILVIPLVIFLLLAIDGIKLNTSSPYNVSNPMIPTMYFKSESHSVMLRANHAISNFCPLQRYNRSRPQAPYVKPI